MTYRVQLALVLSALFWAGVPAQDPTVSLAGVQDLSERARLACTRVPFRQVYTFATCSSGDLRQIRQRRQTRSCRILRPMVRV